MEGVTGLSALGVWDMNYKMVFLANHVSISSGNAQNNEFNDQE